MTNWIFSIKCVIKKTESVGKSLMKELYIPGKSNLEVKCSMVKLYWINDFIY